MHETSKVRRRGIRYYLVRRNEGAVSLMGWCSLVRTTIFEGLRCTPPQESQYFSLNQLSYWVLTTGKDLIKFPRHVWGIDLGQHLRLGVPEVLILWCSALVWTAFLSISICILTKMGRSGRSDVDVLSLRPDWPIRKNHHDPCKFLWRKRSQHLKLPQWPSQVRA